MFVIVAYDMENNKKRTKLMKKLKNYLNHIQGSVFEGYLSPPIIDKMVKELKPLIDKKTDSLRIWKIPETSIKDVYVLGFPEISKNESFKII
jgi:CRISPR-associated protein Cas2